MKAPDAMDRQASTVRSLRVSTYRRKSSMRRMATRRFSGRIIFGMDGSFAWARDPVSSPQQNLGPLFGGNGNGAGFGPADRGEAHFLIEGKSGGRVQRAGLDRDDARVCFPGGLNGAAQKPARKPEADRVRHQAEMHQPALLVDHVVQFEKTRRRTIQV